MTGERGEHPVFATLTLRIASALTLVVALGLVAALLLRVVETVAPTWSGGDPRQQQRTAD